MSTSTPYPQGSSGFSAALRDDAALRAAASRRTSLTQKARLVVEIVPCYLRVRRLVDDRPLSDVLAILRDGVRDLGHPAGDAVPEHLTALRLSRAVRRTLRRLPGDTRCLTQSLVLTRMLSRRGIGSTLVISVAPPREDFVAHAWVEHGGEPVLPAYPPDFGRLAEL